MAHEWLRQYAEAKAHRLMLRKVTQVGTVARLLGRSGIYDQWKEREEQRIVLQRQFYQQSL
jgi:hypothetical protein